MHAGPRLHGTAVMSCSKAHNALSPSDPVYRRIARLPRSLSPYTHTAGSAPPPTLLTWWMLLRPVRTNVCIEPIPTWRVVRSKRIEINTHVATSERCTISRCPGQVRLLSPGHPHAFFFETLEESRHYTISLDGVDNADARTGAFTTLKVG